MVSVTLQILGTVLAVAGASGLFWTLGRAHERRSAARGYLPPRQPGGHLREIDGVDRTRGHVYQDDDTGDHTVAVVQPRPVSVDSDPTRPLKAPPEPDWRSVGPRPYVRDHQRTHRRNHRRWQ